MGECSAPTTEVDMPRCCSVTVGRGVHFQSTEAVGVGCPASLETVLCIVCYVFRLKYLVVFFPSKLLDCNCASFYSHVMDNMSIEYINFVDQLSL